MAFGVKPWVEILASSLTSCKTMACCLAFLSHSCLLCKIGKIMPTSWAIVRIKGDDALNKNSLLKIQYVLSSLLFYYICRHHHYYWKVGCLDHLDRYFIFKLSSLMLLLWRFSKIRPFPCISSLPLWWSPPLCSTSHYKLSKSP